jgi:type II secretion system protein C
MKSLTLKKSKLLHFYKSTWIQYIILVLMAWIALMLVYVFREYVSETPTREYMEIEVTRPPRQPETGEQLIAQLPGRDPLDETRQASMPPTASGIPGDAPETQLGIVLRGLLSSDSPQFARAIIEDQQGQLKSYVIGDVLPDNAKLHAIQDNRVILMHNGRYETLQLHRNDVTLPLSRTGLVAGTGPDIAHGALAQHPTSSSRPPKLLSQLIHIKRKFDPAGHDVGFTAHPGIDPELFKRVGLRTGDELIAIGGIRTDTPANLWHALESANRGASITMTILREEKEARLSFTLPE